MLIENVGEIKIFALDVDGTLTDGMIYIGEEGEIMKAFNAHDSLGLMKLLDTDIVPVIITGRSSRITQFRANELGIREVYQGIEDKLGTLKAVCEKYDCTIQNAIYVGDDENDLVCMEAVAYVACPQDACKKVKEIANYISGVNGGKGAVRDVIDTVIFEME